MALRIKRGTNAERLSYTPELGELIYVTDYESAGVSPVWIGDGSTTGGNEVSSGSGGSGITDIVNDTTPQLGGNLDLNSYDITGTGDIDTTGNINATGSIDVNLNIDAGGYVNATTMAANLFNGSFDGDLTGSVFSDSSSVIVDGVNNAINANSATIGTLDINNLAGLTTTTNLTLNTPTGLDFNATNSAQNLEFKLKGKGGAANLYMITQADTDISAINYSSTIFGGRSDLNGDYYHNAIYLGRESTLIASSSNGQFDQEAEFLTWTNTGRLGIGAYTPAATLDVRGDAVFTGEVSSAAFKGTFVGDDSTILVDGVAGKVNIASANIEELSNVTTTSPQAGQVLKYNGSEWVNDVDVAGSGGSGGIGNIGVGADDSTLRLINSGESFLVLGGTAITTTSDAEGNITINGVAQDFAFSSLTGKPTTIAGYGITDAFDGVFASLTSKPTTIAGYGITDALALGTSSTTALAGDTALFSGAFADLTSKPTTLAGYGITDALSSGGNITLGGDLDVGGNSIVSASNGPINIAPNGSGAIELNGQVKFAEGMIEKFATTNGATGVTALDCSTGNVHYLTAPAGDITANFTNLNLTAEYATNVTVVIDQGGTEREITAVQIGGVAQTIVWQGNSAPTGTANGVDSFSFTILNDGGTYVVLGQMVAFGGV